MGKVAARVPIQSLILLLFFVHATLAVNPSAVLVSYSFDDNQIDSGPDTFTIFQHAKGTVRLNSVYRLSGYRSVEIRDVAGDADFPELQGYFALRQEGSIFAHFAMMTPDPREDLNLALAGPQSFTKEKEGIVFWLNTRDGFLCHMSDSIPKKLFQVTPFVWYVVDLAYYIDEGRYDLAIRQEGIELPIVALKNQISAFHQRGSAVDKFSFIGDTGEDTSNVVYYLDDVVIGIDRAINQLPFVAPGRRKLFIDYWNEYQTQIRQTPACLPAQDLSDFGLRADSEDDEAGLKARELWKSGCELLASGDVNGALSHFEAASEVKPQGKIYGLAIAMALAGLHDWDLVQHQMNRISADWSGDVRYGLASAMIGIARGDLDHAQKVLGPSSETDPKSAEEYYFVLLWKHEYSAALQFAIRMSEKKPAWFEKAGDASFFLNDPVAALNWYQLALDADPDCVSVLLKLSDVYFWIGDLEKERFYRESIYGALR